jgi:general secretion pathway protein L
MAKGFKLRTGDPRKFDMVLYAPKTPTATIPGIPRPLRQVKKDELAPCLMPDRLPPFLINFCKGRFGSDSIFHQHRSQWIVTLFLVIVLAGAALLDIYQDISGLEQAIARERQKAYAIYKQTFPEKGTSTINAPELLMESYVNQALKNHRSNNIQTRMEALPAVRVMDMLSELSGRIPDTIDVDLSRLIFNRDQLIISGSLDTFNNVDKLKGLIEKSDLFKKVTISSAKASKTDNRVLFKFIIQM